MALWLPLYLLKSEEKKPSMEKYINSDISLFYNFPLEGPSVELSVASQTQRQSHASQQSFENINH